MRTGSEMAKLKQKIDKETFHVCYERVLNTKRSNNDCESLMFSLCLTQFNI